MSRPRPRSSLIAVSLPSIGEEKFDDEILDEIAPEDPFFPIHPPLPPRCGEQINWHEILDGTNGFQETKLLGRGNFGEVYRCHFYAYNEDGAVKIQDRADLHEEFLAEVKTLARAYHPNVIRLFGRCYGRRARAIVYELMLNGSLERHIFGPEISIKLFQRGIHGPQGLQHLSRDLDWDSRIKIAMDVCHGLRYIHEVLNVIHRDVKAANILLDENFDAKLGDFGSATRISVNRNGYEEQKNMYPIKGTFGWIAPETEDLGLVSTKSDVYSYGIFLFALFTGRKPKALNMQRLSVFSNREKHLWNNWGYAQADPGLGINHPVLSVHLIFQIAEYCLRPYPNARPTMSQVERMIRKAASFQNVPWRW